jgi:RHS repeat-associated protein
MRTICFSLVLASLTLLATPALCQDSPGDEQGVYPSRTYHGTEVEFVNMATGRAIVHIPLLEDHSQRGDLNFTYSLSLTTSGNWTYWQRSRNGPIVWKLPLTPLGISFITDQMPKAFGWTSYKDPDFGYYNYAYYIQTADGGKHMLGGNAFSGTTTRTIDGSGYSYIYRTSPPGGITDRRGVYLPGGCGSSSALVWAEDTNGNQLTCTFTTSAPYVTTVTDTLGRQWTTTSASSDVSGCPVAAQSSTLWTVPGPNGTTRTFKLCTSSVAIHTNFGYSGIQELNGSALLMTGVVLPNSTTYRFDYDGYGDIAKITLPTGGTISYTSRNTRGICDVFADAGRVIASRSVFDGVNTFTWNYSGGVVTDPLGNDAVYSSRNCQDISQIQYYSGSHMNGTLLKTVTKVYQTISDPLICEVYQNVGNPPTLLQSTTTTWPNGQVNQESQSYDSGFTWSDASNTNCNGTGKDTTPQQGYYGLVSQENYYDYGNGSSGPLLSTTSTSYLALSNSSYLSANLLDLKSSVVVLNPSGYKCAETDYAYDDSTRLFSSGVTEEHVTAPNSVRGNLTSVTRQLSSTPCQASATWTPITSYHNIYDTGELYQSIDPLGHTTTYSYSTAYYGAYTTTVTNALNQSTTNVFDFNTGLKTSITDPNLLQTMYSYDNMLRLTQANHPDGGQTTISYQESAYPFSNTVTEKINPNQSKIQMTLFDALGRPTETQLTSDPQGTVFTDTSYDALGRVATVSNPYRSGTDPTSSPGITTFVYDALGRKCVEVPPDGTAVSGNMCPASAPAKDVFTSYSGNTTTVTDAAGRKRQSTTDALGHLTQVVEDPGGLGYITNYSYDALGNLTSVVQNGSHQRSFTYDSLSHLLTSTNPETGTICYGTLSGSQCQLNGYDADGNLVTKTDARGITTCYGDWTGTSCNGATGYDGLNRLLKTTYSNGDPTVTMHYDEPNCLGLAQCANIGHRTSMTDAAGSESWSFDVVDRMHRDQRTTGGITKITTYNLDFAGNITSVTYPTNRVVNYAYDAANRPSTAADGSNGITYATGMQSPPSGCSSSAACYTPQGAFYALSIGQSPSFTGLNLTHLYNNRLQPLEFQASSTGGNAIDISYSFVDPVSLGNAGHVFSTANNLNTSRSQSFGYDQLNRITTAGTTATSGTYCWGYQYGYDAWGNLLYQQAWAPNYNGCSESTMAPVTADGNNHISAFAYDASGNATNDGAFAYTWDAESQMKTAAGVTYTYDGDGRRVMKSSGKIYWYGSGGDILAETDAAGNTLNEYIFFGGKRVAMLPSGSSPLYYVEDFLGSSRVITTNTGVVCYDADFYPYGGERTPYTNNCPSTNNYKFEGKERDTETGNDDFGARYYTERYGRWLSADWSAVPDPVPYANLTNPQTLNLYSMVADDPESFADLDGHCTADGEKHGFWWCVGHALGINETQKEYQARIANERQWLATNVVQNSDQASALRGFTSGQVDKLYWQWSAALYKAACGGFNICEEPPTEAKFFYRTASGSFALYRGGWFDNVTDFKIDANGNVRAGEGARGPSLFDDPTRIPPRFTEINKIGELPDELTIKQVGKPGHYEIVPREPGMSPARFLELLQKIIKDPIE